MGKKVYGKKGKSIHFPLFPYTFFPFSPWGKMGKEVYGKKGKSIHFPLFPYTFFPIFPHEKKWENTHFSMGKNGVGPPQKESLDFSETAPTRFGLLAILYLC